MTRREIDWFGRNGLDLEISTLAVAELSSPNHHADWLDWVTTGNPIGKPMEVRRGRSAL